MNKKHFHISVALISSMALFSLGCGNQEQALSDAILKAKADRLEQETLAKEPKLIQYELKIEEPKKKAKESAETLSTKLENQPLDQNMMAQSPNQLGQAPINGLSPIPEFLDGVDEVDPWLANYVGSYGVLPTRFASEGPFLYSLPVNPRAIPDPRKWDHDSVGH